MTHFDSHIALPGVFQFVGPMKHLQRQILLSPDRGYLSFTHLQPPLGSITVAYTVAHHDRPGPIGTLCYMGMAYRRQDEQFCKATGRHNSLRRLATLLQGTWEPPYNTAFAVTIPDEAIGKDGSIFPRLFYTYVRQRISETLFALIDSINAGSFRPVNHLLHYVHTINSKALPGWLRTK